jgi:hypothetical protein
VSADSAGVRYAGGETTDFGNGSDDPCGTEQEFAAISRADATAQGFDVARQIAWIEQPRQALLTWNPELCSELGIACSDQLAIGVEVRELLLVRRSYRRPGGLCPSAPTQHLAYRAAVHLQTDDASLAGSFYLRLNLPIGADPAQTERYVAQAQPDLRNFSGSLPIHLDLERAHFAYLNVLLALSSDGTSSGYFEPRVRYYDDRGGLAPISAGASWNSDRVLGNEPLSPAAVSTLSDYPGSRLTPLVQLSVRIGAADPEVPVDFTLRLDDRVVRESSAMGGELLQLGEQPFGTRVGLEVRNPNGADLVYGDLLEDGCFVDSGSCAEPGCSAHVEYSVAFNECVNE